MFELAQGQDNNAVIKVVGVGGGGVSCAAYRISRAGRQADFARACPTLERPRRPPQPHFQNAQVPQHAH